MKQLNNTFCHRVGGMDLEFDYILRPGSSKIFVTPIDSIGENACFEVIKDQSGKWSLVHPVPAGIRELEDELMLTISLSLQLPRVA